MKTTWSRLLCLAVTIAILLSFASMAVAENKEIATITLYPANGNLTSGKLGGFLGDMFAENGLAIEVWAYSDDKTNAILASGDLPDVMYINDSNCEIMIQAGMLLNLEEYLDKMPRIVADKGMNVAMNYVREYRSAGTGELWFLPHGVGNYDAGKVDTDGNSLKLNWEFYEGIGAPEFNDMWELIPVMKQMLEAYPYGNPKGTNEDKNYGTVLNSGSDAAYWGNIIMPFQMNGYDWNDLPYLLETNMVDGTYHSILDKDSLYYESLKWYNAVYREGLLDPDSINLDRPTQKRKVDSLNVMVPMGTIAGYGGYYQYLLEDQKIYFNADYDYGFVGLGVSANTKNVDACLKFFEVIANPDNYLISRAGAEGEQWYKDENGHVCLTQRFIDSVKNNTEFKWSEGKEYSLWNTSWLTTTGALTSYTDPDGNPVTPVLAGWKEYQKLNNDSNSTYAKWVKTNGGYASFVDWANAEGKLYYGVSPIRNVAYFTSICFRIWRRNSQCSFLPVRNCLI